MSKPMSETWRSSVFGVTLRRLIGVLAAAALSGGPAAAQQASGAADIGDRGPFSAGLYAGELYKRTYLSAVYAPNALDLASSYIVAANVDYRVYRSRVYPVQLEVELDGVRRFGDAHQYEAVVAPFIRWTAFPWNRYLYTNLRASALGISYATGISAWERQNSGQDKGSNLLQFGALEIAFARNQQSPLEVFIRLHHRSGIYGLINGVDGGSSYLAVGFRVYH